MAKQPKTSNQKRLGATAALGVVVLVLMSIVVGAFYMTIKLQLGARLNSAEKQQLTTSLQFSGKQFVNEETTRLNTGSTWKMLAQYAKGNPRVKPRAGELNALTVSASDLDNPLQLDRLLWFGHSSFLFQTAGKNLLFDPVFSPVASPISWLGSKRYSGGTAIGLDDLPSLDAVLISHDHYDHLDMLTIQALQQKVARFYVPLGVGAHLRLWGVPAEKIVELDWWQQAKVDEIEFTFTPARHFSGRGPGRQNATLWGGWWVKAPTKSLFFSGDSGYGKHFQQIKEQLGSVDIALIECGQYNQNWSEIHMMPEQSAQAAKDLGATLMMPVHWAAFTLSLHDWNEPATRVTAAADTLGQALFIPQIGELVNLDQEPIDRTAWWEANVTAEAAPSAQ